MKKIFGRKILFISVLVFAVAICALAQGSHVVKAQSSGSELSGWAWSDNIGWISFSGNSPAYGVSEDGSGNLTGWAWSDNIGWIKFGGLTGFPSGTGTTNSNAYIDSSGNLHGWARACAGTLLGDCSSMTSRTDGWDGWISLDGSSYGVDFASGNGQYSQGAYTWGSDVVGWISFNPSNIPATTTSSCDPTQEVCGGGGPSGLTPTVNLYINGGSTATVNTETAATLSWNTSNITTCTESSSGIGTDSNWDSALTSGTSSGSKSTLAFGTSGTETYNLTCTATSQAGGGSISANPVTLTVTANNNNNSGMCASVPPNGSLCPGSSAPTSGSSQSSLVGSQSSCPASGSICQYYCPSGYHQVNNQCVGNGTIQEQ